MMRSLTSLLIIAPLALAVAACGDDAETGTNTTESDAPVVATDVANSDDADSGGADDTESGATDDTTAEADDEAAAPGGSGGGGATLTLANGETFEFPTVLCSLEPQMAAGSEILFTATSYDDPGLDITQFGDEGTITGIASISVYDGNFETLWEANSMLGSAVELSLDGSTIRGTGSFVQGEDFGGETVEGEVVANC
jgi:hypothetical protein